MAATQNMDDGATLSASSHNVLTMPAPTMWFTITMKIRGGNVIVEDAAGTVRNSATEYPAAQVVYNPSCIIHNKTPSIPPVLVSMIHMVLL